MNALLATIGRICMVACTVFFTIKGFMIGGFIGLAIAGMFFGSVLAMTATTTVGIYIVIIGGFFALIGAAIGFYLSTLVNVVFVPLASLEQPRPTRADF